MHHICPMQLCFPSRDQLHFALESHRSISDSSLQKKLIDIFADAFANRQRSPEGLRLHIHLLLDTYNNELPLKNQREIFKLFTTALTDIGKEYRNPYNIPSE